MDSDTLAYVCGCWGVAGLIVTVYAGIWLHLAAFAFSWRWGFVSLLIPFGAICFAVKHWNAAWIPAMMFLLGIGTVLMAILLYPPL